MRYWLLILVLLLPSFILAQQQSTPNLRLKLTTDAALNENFYKLDDAIAALNRWTGGTGASPGPPYIPTTTTLPASTTTTTGGSTTTTTSAPTTTTTTIATTTTTTATSTTTTTTTTTTSTTTTTTLTTASSWATAMSAVWLLDETSGTRVNATLNTLYDASNISGSDPTSSTDRMQGTRSAVFTAAQARSTTGTFATVVSPISTGCWVKGALPGTNNAFLMHDGQNNPGTFKLMTASTLTGYGFSVWDSGTVQKIASAAATANTWTHVVGTMLSGDSVKVYINGVLGNSVSMTTAVTHSAPIYLGENQTWAGQLDECFVAEGLLDATAACRICSCGIDGLLCTCSGTTFSNSGRNVTNCNSCTLPSDCTTTTPVTPSTTTTTLASPALDWTSYFTAVWPMDEASGTRVNVQGTTTRNLIEYPTTPILGNTFNLRQGLASLQSMPSKYLQTSDSALVAMPGAAAMGCMLWVRANSATPGRILQNVDSTGKGWWLMWNGTKYGWGNSANVGNGDAAIFTANVGEWHHLILGAQDSLQDFYVDGALQEEDTNPFSSPAGTQTFKVGGTVPPGSSLTPQSFDGQIDEVACDATSPLSGTSNTSWCRICSCGINGKLCGCSGTSYTNKGRNTFCASCTLPPCSQVSP